MQFSWINKLYDISTPGWKVIPLRLMKTNLGINFKFRSNLDISVEKLKLILKNWCLHLTSTPALLSAIASQALWYNKNIKIDNKSIYLAEFSKKGLNCVGHLFNERQKLKTWDELKQEYRFHENKRFLFMQLLHAIPKSWKEELSNVKENIHNLIIQDHHIIRKNHMYFLNRLSSKEIYNFLIAQKEEQTASRLYYQKKFSNSNLDRKIMYALSQKTTNYVLFSLNY